MRKFITPKWLQAALLACLITVTTVALSQSKTTKQKPVGEEPSATDSSTDSNTDSDSGKKDHAKGKITNVVNAQQTSDTDTDSASGKKKHGKAIVKTTSSQQTGATTEDRKNISDGAAKGQAQEGVAPNPKGGSQGSEIVVMKQTDKASANVVSQQNSSGGGGKNNGIVVTKPIDQSSPKNVSDGAAKGQSTDGMMQNPKGGGGGGNGTTDSSAGAGKATFNPFSITRKTDASSAPASGGSTSNTNGATGSLSITKSTDSASPKLMEAAPAPAPATGSTSGMNVIMNPADGAAKSQAVEGTAQDPNSKNGKGKSSTSVITVDGLEHSHETVNAKAPKPHPVGGGGSGTPVESVAAQTPKGKSTTTDDQSTTDTTTKPATGEKKH